ncbi:hypothetical protein L6452_31710 [Arctium lappa]|uniref:Uncharacterized protein n=1 Tax=Arctium lappa TaxID=4217 RepID=A0ACB8Z285_ARCLA|nr:hypothetical protein L6452_31710 [Arctium lappa]
MFLYQMHQEREEIDFFITNQEIFCIKHIIITNATRKRINKHREEIPWRREEIEVVAGEERRSKLLPWRRGDGCVRWLREKKSEKKLEKKRSKLLPCIEVVTLEKMLDWAMEEMLDEGDARLGFDGGEDR